MCDGNEEGRKRGAVDQGSPENSELKCKDKDPTLPNTKFYFVGFLEAILKVCVECMCLSVGIGPGLLQIQHPRCIYMYILMCRICLCVCYR